VNRVTPIIGMPRLAALRSTSPARTPRPPAYVGMSFSSAISMERYATCGITAGARLSSAPAAVAKAAGCLSISVSARAWPRNTSWAVGRSPDGAAVAVRSVG
jgi:hypothetical protein